MPWTLDEAASHIAAGIADGRDSDNPRTRRKLTASPRPVRGVAWSILGGSGPLDSGSNPDGPISGRAHQAEFTRLSGTNVSCSFETESSSLVLALCRSRECRDPVERDRKVRDTMLQLVLELVKGFLHRPTPDQLPGLPRV